MKAALRILCIVAILALAIVACKKKNTTQCTGEGGGPAAGNTSGGNQEQGSGQGQGEAQAETPTPTPTPTQTQSTQPEPEPAGVSELAVGYNHSCARLKSNDIKCWGQNHRGQLGMGDSLARTDLGQLGVNLKPLELGQVDDRPVNIFQVSTNESTTCVFLETGEIKCWGNNIFGQLGVGDTFNRGMNPNEITAINFGTYPDGRKVAALKVSVGKAHACALLSKYEVTCWGSNLSGQLGLGEKTQKYLAPALTAQGNPRVVDLGGRYIQDSPGELPHYTPYQASDVVTGASHTCALVPGRGILCWGNNLGGQLGRGDKNPCGTEMMHMGSNLIPVNLGKDRVTGLPLHPIAIASKGQHTCALLDSNDVKCWGVNQFGQLGQGDTKARGNDPGEMGDALPPIEVRKIIHPIPGGGRILELTKATAIAAGVAHTCVLLKGASQQYVKCWGNNDMGQLGIGDTHTYGTIIWDMERLKPVDLGTDDLFNGITDIELGTWHSCALAESGRFKCWGAGDGGQLGNGKLDNLGDNEGEMGDALPFGVID